MFTQSYTVASVVSGCFHHCCFCMCGPDVLLAQDRRALHLSAHSPSALTPSLAAALLASVCHAEQRKMQKKSNSFSVNFFMTHYSKKAS